MNINKYSLKEVLSKGGDNIFKILNHMKWSNAGDSFVVGLDVMQKEWWRYSEKEVLMYIALVSLRPYTEYLRFSRLTLDFDLVPVDVSILNRSRLLYIRNREVFFHWEEEAKNRYLASKQGTV